MLHEYGAGFSQRAIDEALSVPLAQVFALYAACRARYGCLNGAGYHDRDMIRKMETSSL